MEVGETEIIYLSHHQNDFSIKMGSDESLVTAVVKCCLMSSDIS